MTCRPISFVLHATNYSFFDPRSCYFEQYILKTTELAVRTLASSVLIPLIGTTGALWHATKAIYELPSLSKSTHHMRIALQDASYAYTFAVNGIITASSYIIIAYFVTSCFSQTFSAVYAVSATLMGVLAAANSYYIIPQIAYDLDRIIIDRAMQEEQIPEHLYESTRATLYTLAEQYWSGDDDEETISGWTLQIDRNELKNNPEAILDAIGKNHYRHSPNETIFKVSYTNETGVDLKGLSRDFLSQLFKHLTTNQGLKRFAFTKVPGGVLPTVFPNSQEAKYRFLPDEAVCSLTNTELIELIQLAGQSTENPKLDATLDATKVKECYNYLRQQIPPLSKQEQIGYEILGKFISMSQRSKDLPIGPCFTIAFYNTLMAYDYNELLTDFCSLSDASLLKLYAQKEQENPLVKKMFKYQTISIDELKDNHLWSTDLLYLAHPNGDFPEYFTTEKEPCLEKLHKHFTIFQYTITDQLLRMAQYDTVLPALHAIGMGMVQTYSEAKWNALKRAGGSALEKTVQGTISKSKIKEIFDCENHDIKNYFFKWIDAAEEKILSDFLTASTGSPTLSNNQKFFAAVFGETERYPAFHTCSGQIDIPAYKTYDQFKQKLELAITNALASGFSLI